MILKFETLALTLAGGASSLRELIAPAPPVAERALSGVHKGGFSKGGFSSNNVIITHKLLNPLY